MDVNKNTIEGLLEDATVFGTGFIPITEDQWWFAIGNEKYWKKAENNQLMISFTAIGGTVEQNEPFIDAIYREVKEETGVDAIIYDSNKSMYIEGNSDDNDKSIFHISEIRKITFAKEPRPWIVYKLYRKDDTLGVAVYKGKFSNEPYPRREVPALLLLPPTKLLQCPKKLSSLLDTGAIIREQDEPIPREAIIYSFGSATILQQLLK